MSLSEVKALIFDVFGTVVDWRSSIIHQCQELGRLKGVEADWGEFADSWRGQYRPFMDKVRNGGLPWTNLDSLHRMSLDVVLEQFDLTGFSDSEKDQMNLFWHNLRPWSDSVPGLYRLKSKYIIATMSNGNIALMTNMAKNGGLPWDCILGAEVARHYKPDPESYQTAVNLLGLTPNQVMMTAAHQGDLLASQKVGLQTGFIPRPMEHGPGRTPDPTPDPSFNVVATDFMDLATKMGV
ncbi:MAG: haloacid dehalogenase type II [Chloroflexota bacterium]|nr:haloacid dehalogenase type II [Chloroflexota bacterium]|tara:strand:+ start:152 stop:865 length:714 start_codon:yes stop_codon:yes gene_type:complete